MTEEQLDEWVAALRSGEYKQGKEVLHNSKAGTFCCLGVYASLNGLFESHEDGQGVVRVKSGERMSILCPTYLDPEDISKSSQIELARMNDQRVPFEDIADYIEERKEDFVD